MTPTAPSTGPALPASAQGTAPQPSPTGSEPPAAPRPLLGASAVTQADAAAKTALGVPGHAKKSVPEIPPDPPPVKGLGIPAAAHARGGRFRCRARCASAQHG